MNENTEVETTQTTEQTEVSLTVQDLASIRGIIDVASQRGAFKANELEAVGKTYNKLNSFLESVTATANKEE